MTHELDSLEPDRLLAPLRAMIGLLPPTAMEEIARALHAKLNAPPTTAERRVRELGLLARVLEQQPQYPGRLPYINRKIYDQERRLSGTTAPTSSQLQRTFGSWARVCHAAWGLLEDGRCWAPGDPWPRPPRASRNFDVDDAVASVRRCADTLGHIPSSSEYHHWILNRRARARTLGLDKHPFVHHKSVLRLLAPDRSAGNGWRLVISRVFG